MCGVVAGAAVAGAVIAAAGTGYSIYTQRQAVQMQQQALEREAVSSTLNAAFQLAESKAEEADVSTLARDQRADIRKRADSVIARGRSQFSAGNVMLGAGGSVLSWEEDVEFARDLDIADAEFNEAKARWAQQVGRTDATRVALGDVAGLERRGRNLDRISQMNQVGTAIGGASRIARSAYQFGLNS